MVIIIRQELSRHAYDHVPLKNRSSITATVINASGARKRCESAESSELDERRTLNPGVGWTNIPSSVTTILCARHTSCEWSPGHCASVTSLHSETILAKTHAHYAFSKAAVRHSPYGGNAWLSLPSHNWDKVASNHVA